MYAGGNDDVVSGAVEQNTQRIRYELAILDEEDGRRDHLVVACVQGKREKESASFSKLALHPYRSAVQLDELTRDGQAQAGTVMRTRR